MTTGTAPMTAAGHGHSFPVNPPDGSMFAPGPCECGKTHAQSEADKLLAGAVFAMIRAYGAAWPAAVPASVVREIAPAAPESPADALQRIALDIARAALSRLASGDQMAAAEDAEAAALRGYAARMLADIEAVTGTAGDAPDSAGAQLAAIKAHMPSITDALRHALSFIGHVPGPSSQAAAGRYRNALAIINGTEASRG